MVYRAIDVSNAYFVNYTLVPLVVIVYQGINFHHYIVDSIIWKLRKRDVQSALKIS
ncbi:MULTISPECIES: hypothetical protein [unclassified Duganella]|uniref:hypothetical protein n=1 Tax=unclassified Duganella TaxID=2636909 RepID=UPI0018F48749|nr:MULTISPECIES: hypothetical protein [unclassified Duganella]